MSYFFALELSDAARAQVAAFAERWQGQVDPSLNAHWVAPENYHVTLKYLGDIPPERVAVAVTDAVRTMNAAVFKSYIKPLLIEQKPLVLFPAGKPAVLWIEIIPTDTLQSLSWQMEGIQSGQGVRRDHRPYKPHITLAYCKPEADIAELLLTEQAFDPFTVNRFVLMQTLPPEARANGAKSRYNIVHTFPFGDTPS